MTAELAFACSWWRPRESTWSFTSASLRQGLLDIGTDIVDIEAQPSVIIQAVVAASTRLFSRVPWKYTQLYRHIEEKRVSSATRRIMPRAVLELADIVVPTAVPTFCYQDMCYAVAIDNYPVLGPKLISTIPTSLDTLRRLSDGQKRSLASVDGIFAMGRWYRDYLVNNMNIAPERVYTIGAGLAPIYQDLEQRSVRPRSDRTRIIFIGTDFIRKGGDLLMEAVRLLNVSGDRKLTLTVVGPDTWPLYGEPPEWVNFCGRQPGNVVLQLLKSHDLFVMPSRFEAYGKVFLEARATGLPCIGRDCYSMPELIEPGVGGAMWSSSNTYDLSELICKVLDDDELYKNCAINAAEVAKAYSWQSVAARMLAVIRQHSSPWN